MWKFAYCAGVCLIALSPAPSFASIVVPGSANPFLAGQSPGTGCCGGDAAPAQSPTLAVSGATLGGSTLTFSTSGGANYTPDTPNATADGNTSYVFSMTSDYGTGISGALNVNVSGLVGVFVGSGVPTGAAPAQRDDGLAFSSLAPDLNQIFWIGDGRTGDGDGSGAVQSFLAPLGATRLFLGTVDGSGWSNNSGAITVEVSGFAGSAPEPSTWGMMLIGFAGLGLAGYRSSRKRPVFDA